MIDPQEFAQAQSGRSAMYRLIEKLFAAPLSQADLDALTRANLPALACGSPRAEHGLREMARFLQACDSGTREALARDYTSAFHGVQSIGGRMALPYESAHQGESQQLMGAARGKVLNVFKKQALKLDAGIDLPEDHLAFLCEFMAAMAQRTAASFSAGDVDKTCESLRLQRAFLRSHILSWYEHFAKLAARIVDEPFYCGALDAAGGFFALDAAALDDMLADLGAPEEPFDLAWWETPPTTPGMPHASDSRASDSRASDGRVRIRRGRCIRKRGDTCSRCVAACPRGLDPFEMSTTRIRADCTGCGLCVKACPTQALSLKHH